MKLKLPMILFLFIMAGQICFSQAKLNGDLMLNVGGAQNDLYNKTFILGVSTSPTQHYPQTQKALTFLDFNITYRFKASKWICKPIVGFGYMPLGFMENGVYVNDSSKIVNYTLPVRLDFISIYGGLFYTITSKKWFKISASQTINPMINISNPLRQIARFGILTRTNLVIDFNLKDGGSISISPFFQSGITSFNKNKEIKESPDYYPFGYGINVGTYLNTK